MTRFCTQCGTQADDDARSCEDCGAPFKPVARAAAVRPATTPLAPSGRNGKRLAVAGAAVAAVLAGGGLAAYLLADEQASPEVA